MPAAITKDEFAFLATKAGVTLTAVQPNEAAKIDAVPPWDNMGNPNFTMPFNVAGLPVMSICSGFGAGGLPVAIQIVGKPFAEATVFRAGQAYEAATDWRSRRPSVDTLGVKQAAE